MEVTKVFVKKEEKENSRLIGFAEIILDDCLKIKGIRIIRGEERIFAAMPSKRLANDKNIDYVHPITKELREKIDNAVKEAYENLD